MSNVTNMQDWEYLKERSDAILMLWSTITEEDGWVKVTGTQGLDALILSMLDAPVSTQVTIESPELLADGMTIDDVHSVIEGIADDRDEHGWFKVNKAACREAIRHAVDLALNPITSADFAPHS